ncbi:MAG TPA: cytochrome c3 family protein [Verrucomicrobiae bacterium]|nr:cytochrome c3 family protein [Verrucomicrobiae bacterium]
MKTLKKRIFFGAFFFAGFGFFPSAFAQGPSNEDCLACHQDKELSKTLPDGRSKSLFVEPKKFEHSVHASLGCVDCHADLAGTEIPHKENPAPPQCGGCHSDVEKIYDGSLHGRAVRSGARLAPRCWDCHGSHDIKKADAADSRVRRYNVPFLCGRCHKEGTEVSRTYDIPQDSILTHYSVSIHGEGLFKKGLTVSAVCTDCHTSHNILPHTDPRSSIFRENVPKTCEKCHGMIEQVHQKVIRGELWEKAPNQVPVCVDCHAPHRVRKVFYELGMADRDCLKCHSDPKLFTQRDGKRVSLFVDTLEVKGSIHRNTACAQCHTGASPTHKRPCATIKTKVDCSTCHAEVVQTYAASTHGKLNERGDPNAPFCRDCHGVHGIKEHRNPNSPTYPTRVPDLCGQCHREGEKAALRLTGEKQKVVKNYVESIHGKGLLQSGLVVTAMCTDCHTPHHELPSADTASSVSRKHIAETCAQCHHGIYEQFAKSIHFPGRAQTDKPLPLCHDCHSAHTITRTDKEGFKLGIINQCGRCHQDVAESYFDTFHGKVSKLGYTAAAKCYDCHGAHDILPPWEPASHLSRQNIVATCGKCHPGSHRRFAGYLTHATHHDRKKYPVLFYTFWFMTFLLVGTFGFFGVHTLLWLPRSFQALKHRRKLEVQPHGKEYLRFDSLPRRLHVLVIISFLGLALTGMMLKFSYLGWAQFLSRILGGFESAGYIHRICALITFFYFSAHIFDLVRRKRKEGKSWKEFLTGAGSMLPNKRDAVEFWQTTKWFLGLGPRPAYGRWTYWEKFDYFAVFWGVTIIGSTGLVLWFPEFFTHLIPGWFINVATIIHSDEALLAVGFIFTVHFFNTHFRPDKFPMDTVIFTGRVPVEELKADRPREYEELVASGELEKRLVDPLPPVVVKTMKIFGWAALSIGIILVLLIIWAQIFGYR